MIGLVEQDYSDAEAGPVATERAAALRDCMSVLRAGMHTVAATVPQPAVGPSVPTPAAAAATVTTAPEGSPLPNEILLSELVTAEMAERFLSESMDLVDDIEKGGMGLTTRPTPGEAVNELFRAVHTMKGNAGFFGHGFLERLCMELETILDAARRGAAPVNEALANAVIAKVDEFRHAISTVRIASAAESEEECAGPVPATSAASGPDDAVSVPAAQAGYRPLGEILVGIGAATEDDVHNALDLQEKPLGAILVEEGKARPEDVERALEIQKSAVAPEKPQAEEFQRKEIRVDTSKLDRLFELVGELITAEAMVANSPDIAGLKLDSFSKSFGRLNKISREIQETAMMIRMIPLDGLFHKMSRLVRDLSRKFGKPVDFQVSGQDTEMDKNVIEQVSDPLVHILRNAIDHGLESPEARRAAGKPEVGSVHLHAKYEGSEIWISVADDGAGLDRARILAKAAEKGMLQGDPALLPDDEVWQFIFEPGFSTAARVSDVSGRGVGMDVVKKNLERIRGRVDIRTEAGQGTEFILKIPLTMAIMDGITVRCGPGYYSLPLGDILEFFQAQPSQVCSAEGGEEAINLRGEVLPLVRLAEVFGLGGASLDPLSGILIVVQSAGRKVCLLIDEVVGNQQIVVKSLSEYLGKVEGISGCSILGNGTVSFIIDTGKLMAMRVE